MVRSDLRAWWMVLVNFAIIALAFALPILWLNPLTVVAALLHAPINERPLQRAYSAASDS